jgi:uncharacterized protein YdeI (YjbR/CyaY-like superfamily)
VSGPEEILQFCCRDEWRAWLAGHHATERQAWLIHPKKDATQPGLHYEEAVEEALCFGWIDGQLRSMDGERFALRYSPRRRGSVWSVGNKQRVAKLIRQGRMTEAGLAAVRHAKESGEWQAASRREAVDEIPADLVRALRRHQGRLAAFRALPKSRRAQFLWWIDSAKRTETRRRRIRAVVDRVGG